MKGPAHQQPSAPTWLPQGCRDEILGRRRMRPLPPQSLCLWALASCSVRAEDQGPS